MASPAGRASSSSPGGQSSAAILLGRQFKQMQKENDIPGISCGLVDDNMFEWEIMLMLDEDMPLYGGE
jgi:ubiquitin-conjugating enzyme E2 G1